MIVARTPLAVVVRDLDDFKRINDAYGHTIGDKALREMGSRLAQRLADAEIVARIGGDEFVVVAAGVELADTPLLLRRIDQAFTDTSLYIDGLIMYATCSLGLAHEPGLSEGGWLTSARQVEQLLERADREIYAQKRSRAGVNRLLKPAETYKGAE
jgi:diguanylate cyclase (GGDEF)-like protein